MKDLIERLEKATGPDRRLHAAIAVAAGLASEANPHPTAEGEYARYFFEGRPEECHNRCPNYTGSIDAAVTLMPSEREWRAGVDLENRKAWASVGDDVWDEANGDITAIAKTPALALCIAALKAHACAERDLTKMEASNG